MIIQNKIANEMAVFKNQLLKEDKETIFNHAFKIETYGNTEMFLTNNLEILTEKELDFLKGTENILFQFYDYFSNLESGEIDKEMIKEFLNYAI